MSLPRVSVALCTCNGEPFIGEQVRSILRQTMPVSEVVVRDDASTDSTLAEIKRVWREVAQGNAVPVLRLHRNPVRLGVASNFESALSDCTGDLIALCDQDDVWHPARMARLVQRFEHRKDLLMVHGNARLVDASGRTLGRTLFDALSVSERELGAISAGRGWQPLLDRNLVTGATSMLRRSLLTLALPIPPSWLHDEWLGIVAALLGGLEVERVPLLDYRQHGGNLIGARREGLSDWVRRAIEPRGSWMEQRVLRANALEARAVRWGSLLGPAQHEAIREKAAHHRARAALPPQRLARVAPIWREWRTGRYARYGRGALGLLRDLLQPA